MNRSRIMLKEIKIEVTHDCKLKCVHCSSIADCTKFNQIEWQDCKRIVEQAKEMGVADVAFSGGEPLLWPHINNALLYAKQLGFYTSIYSTGFVDDVELSLESLRQSMVDKIIFSLYAGCRDIHDSITKVRGSFDTTISAIEAAIRLGIKAELHFVPMKANFSELHDVVRLANELGIDRVSILRIVPQGRGSASGLELSREDTALLKSAIEELREEGENLRLGSPYSILCFPDSPRCGAAISKMTISPTLSIAPCDAFKQITAMSLGIDDDYENLASCSLEDAWEKSEYFTEVRKHLFSAANKTCNECTSFPTCNSGCLAQKVHQTGTLSKIPDPLCMQQPRLHVA